MTKYIIRRLIQALPTIFGITILTFFLMVLAPGDPARLLIDQNTTESERARLEAQLGVNDPWYLQYLYWLIGDDWVMRDYDGDGELDAPGQRYGILRGDWGRSFTQGKRPVMDYLGQFILPTIELTMSALAVGVIFGVTIGILAAIWQGTLFDNATRVMAVIFNAVPNFWLGLILILIFASTLDWFPVNGRCPRVLIGGCPPLYERLEYLVLPVFTLGTVFIASYSRYMRASMLDVVGQDYMRTAKAKGLNNRQVWFRHGARNALIPLATFLGPALTTLWAGAVLTETIFSWPGIGRQTIQAITQQDYPVVMAIVVISSIATVLGFILSDILYALIDPRIRFS